MNFCVFAVSVFFKVVAKHVNGQFFNVGIFSSETDKFVDNMHRFEILSLCGLSSLGKVLEFVVPSRVVNL